MDTSTVVFDNFISKDQLACNIANLYIEWNTLRSNKLNDWDEIRSYIFATDTTKTTNSKLPWKNKTTIPKLCQIRDNLYANYMAALFPKRKWLVYEANNKDSAQIDKKNAIQNYMKWGVDQPQFKTEFAKAVYDIIDNGNAFLMPDWMDQSVYQSTERRTQQGYVGPVIKRISPIDIVFNPTASSFYNTAKIIRSLVNIGDIKDELAKNTTNENQKDLEDLFKYMKELREHAFQTGSTSELVTKDRMFNVDGFTSFQAYLRSDYVELLTFYGDLYDRDADKYYKNYQFKVVDRHKMLSMRPDSSNFGIPPIFHFGWRIRQDNLWAMGPLDNLVGMQYRLDHIENMKADCFDLTAYPPLKIKGQVEDFEWGPMERIYVSDEGDVELMSPDINALNANMEIKNLQDTMEMMAGAPKEAMGFRTPGEKTAYEVQRIENAASRIFTTKTVSIEEQLLEPVLNGMLELAVRNISSEEIRVFDDEFKAASFQTITAEDLAGNGRIRPIAARHFAEKAETVQNLNNFFGSNLGQNQTMLMHWSMLKVSKLFEDLLEVQDFELVTPYIGLMEQAEAQKMAAIAQQNTQMEAMTPSGLSQDDSDPEMEQGGLPQMGSAPQSNTPESIFNS